MPPVPPLLRRVALPLATSSLLAACNDPAAPGRSAPLTRLPRALTAAELQAVNAGNAFTFDLLREVNARRSRANVLISPLSASVALGMTANGAAGETEAAMRRTIGLPGQSAQEMNEAYRGLTKLLLSLDPAVKVGVANSIWYRSGFPVMPSFLAASRTYFDAEVNAANFDDPATVGRINDWARAKTNGKIEKVVDALSSRDVMLLMNALYFKGSWRSRFDPALTRSVPFTRDDGSSVAAKLMWREEAALRHGGADGAAVGELPYGSGAFVMTIVLPPRGTTVDALVASLDAAKWERLIGSLRDVSLAVGLPKFRMKFEDSLNVPLTKLGMGVAFGDGADFSRIAAGDGLAISYVKQNTFVDVDEEGTEAAAVTTIGIRLVSLPSSFTVDRPFVFAIRERLSGAILFVGKVGDPTAG